MGRHNFESERQRSKIFSMPNYTLHYFNGRGRAEILRMMMSMAGVKYMDKRYEFSDWDRCRSDFPCMRLPCLEMDDGCMMPETMAICRYLAREHNFYPRSNMDMMRCDYICDCFYEIMHDYMRYYHWKNGRFRYNMNDYGFGGDSMRSNYDNYMHWRYMNTFNRIMPFMERTLCMRNGGSQFFMGNDMMWCDMMMYCCMENMMMENQSMFSKYPRLMSLYQRMGQHPKISAYLKSRRSTNW